MSRTPSISGELSWAPGLQPCSSELTAGLVGLAASEPPRAPWSGALAAALSLLALGAAGLPPAAGRFAFLRPEAPRQGGSGGGVGECWGVGRFMKLQPGVLLFYLFTRF